MFAPLIALLGISNPVIISLIRICLLSGTVIIAYRAFIKPKEGIVWLLIITSFNVIGEVAKFPYFGNITLFHITLLFFIAGWLTKSIRESIPLLPRGIIFNLVLLFLMVTGISVLYSPNRNKAVVDFIRLCALVLLFITTTRLSYTKKDTDKFAKTLVALGLANAGLSYFQLITRKFIVSSARMGVIRRIPHFLRASGFFFDPNKFAGLMMFCFLMAFALLIYTQRKKLYSAILVLLGSTLLLTFSRSAWVGTFSGCVVILLFAKKPVKKIFVFLLVISIFFYTATQLPRVGVFMRHRVKSLFHPGSSSSSIVRKDMAISAVKIFLDHPMGIGWRGFPVAYHKYMLPGTPRVGLTGREHVIMESHSLPFTIIAEFGIAGVVLSFLLVFHVLKYIVTTFKTLKDDKLRAVFISLSGIWCAFLVRFCFYSDIFDNLFWIGFGLLITIGRASRKLVANSCR